MSQDMRQEMDGMKTVNRRIVATLVRLEGKVDDMAERMATKDDLAVLRSDVYQKFEGLTAVVENLGERMTIQSDLLSQQGKMLAGQGKTLDEHGKLLAGQGKTLDEHGKLLAEQGKTLDEHGKMLTEQGKTLDEHGKMLKNLQPRRS